jgi:hypothetical protein
MKNLLLLLFPISLFASCKNPLPVYFDKPIGVQLDTFPRSMQGNYYPADDVMRKGMKEVEKYYTIRNGKIVPNDSTLKPDEQIAPAPVDDKTVVPEENNFYKIAHLNDFSYSHIDSSVDAIEKEKKIAFAFIQVSDKDIAMIIRDSSGGDHRVPLFILGAKVQLRKSDDEYYLNLPTPYGWEYLKLKAWENDGLLSVIQFWFTSYNDKTGDEKIFLKSTAHIYPNMKPIYDQNHLIIGLKAKMIPEQVRKSFERSESDFLLIRADRFYGE